MKIARTSSTLGIRQGQGHGVTLKFSPFTTIQTVKAHISALAHVRKLRLSMSVRTARDVSMLIL